MTQDGFAAAERIAATLDAVAAALVGAPATYYPAATLRGFRRGATHPSADALFGLRLSPNGPGLLTIHGLGTVVEATSLRRQEPSAGAEALSVLQAKLGSGPVRQVADAPSAAAFQLPVTPEAADEKLRPAFVPPLAALASARGTAAPEELSTGSGVEARLIVPSVFHSLAVRLSGPALASHLTEVASELFAGGRPPVRREWALVAAALADEIAAADVVYAGVSALDVDGRRSRASLVVSLSRRALPIQELSVALSAERPRAEVWTVLLPAGPAALLVEARTAPVPAALTADGQRGWVVSSVVEAFIPLPDGATVLTVQLSTPQAEDWELYATAFAQLLETVQVGWDGVAATPPPIAAPVPVPAVEVQLPAATPPPMPPAPPVMPPAPAPAPVAAPFADRSEAGVPATHLASAPVPAQAAPPAAEEAPRPKGTPVRIPPADFDPFAPPAPAANAPATAPEETPRSKGTPVAVPPADFDPFAPPAPAAATVAEEAPRPKGTPVRIPPADFDPFAPPAPAANAPATAPEETPRSKGTPVAVPPADFDPFAAAAPRSTAPAAAPAAPPVAAPVAAPAKPASADPFGTTLSSEPADPFGTVTQPKAAPAAPVVPPKPTMPPTVAPPAAPSGGEPPKSKGTPVRVPPPDFDPFAPPAPAATGSAEPAEDAPKPKGTPVRIPPPDFDPFGNLAPSSAAAPAAPAAPEPPANSPFG
ncbi:hypothetical protein [Kitasatospora paracochleata]|uniref:Uncharacterized protein n=1 Tax=Kitasatospora paracochleata TaxID=58354 RepID=A0ABT1J4H4_9ACTN|nr:hypothetical protein [Kitasatospora paracochleata]MCP2312335.1 hypothetical protein [Kitasatospora paracochleata]